MSAEYDFQFLDGSEVKTLRVLQADIGRANAAKGFHERGDAIREAASNITSDLDKAWNDAEMRDYYTARLALITSEAAEAIEELRHGRAVDETYYPSRPHTDEDGNVKNAFSEPPFKPEGVPSEVADVVIRAFDFAHEAGFDLAAIIDEKLDYNASRAHMHGKKF